MPGLPRHVAAGRLGWFGGGAGITQGSSLPHHAHSQVWPGACHFPDFFLPRAQRFFTRQLANHRQMVPWDGIW